MLADLRFYLSWLLISSCVFSGSGGTETELADLGPLVAPGELHAEREQWAANGRGCQFSSEGSEDRGAIR
jgi:hypothetical protein